MSGENTALGVLHEADENAQLKEQVRELQERLAQHEGGGDVVHPQFQGEVPRYRLNSACYLEDDTLHVEGEEIEYLNTPNTEMVPLNESARKRMEDYLRQLTDGQRLVAEKNGRQAPGILILDKGELLALGGQDARNEAIKVQPVRMPEEKGIVYPMPNLPEAKAQARRRGKVQPSPVVSAKPPAPPKKTDKPAQQVLGTRYSRDASSSAGG